MPIESATYIDTLQSDWPLGTDPESAGDDHIRMVKKVLQNTFPYAKSPLGATNDILTTVSKAYMATQATTDPVFPSYGKIRDPFRDDGTLMPLEFTPLWSSTSIEQKDNPNFGVTWGDIMNAIYPVGHILISSKSTNPNTYLGFGTWTQRSGMLAAVGTVKDKMGYSYNIANGDRSSGCYWRVQDGHLVAADHGVTVTGTTDSAGGHEHTMPTAGDADGVSAPPAAADGKTDTGETKITTDGAGDHTHKATLKGTVTIGEGGATEGGAFVNPYYGVYVWERTA